MSGWTITQERMDGTAKGVKNFFDINNKTGNVYESLPSSRIVERRDTINLRMDPADSVASLAFCFSSSGRLQ
jgi:hypothetical protein